MYNLRKAQMFSILTDPDILLHTSCTPAGDKGSKLSLQPALMDKFIPLKGQMLHEANFRNADCICWRRSELQTHTHRKKKKKKKKGFPVFSSFQVRRDLHNKKKSKKTHCSPCDTREHLPSPGGSCRKRKEAHEK